MHACVLSHFTRVQLFDAMDCSLPGSFVHGISQARILELFAVPSSRGSSSPRDRIMYLMSPSLAGRFFTTSATWEAPNPEHLLLISILTPWWASKDSQRKQALRSIGLDFASEFTLLSQGSRHAPPLVLSGQQGWPRCFANSVHNLSLQGRPPVEL